MQNTMNDLFGNTVEVKAKPAVKPLKANVKKGIDKPLSELCNVELTKKTCSPELWAKLGGDLLEGEDDITFEMIDKLNNGSI
jgi:hypothetical protein